MKINSKDNTKITDTDTRNLSVTLQKQFQLTDISLALFSDKNCRHIAWPQLNTKPHWLDKYLLTSKNFSQPDL